MISQRKSYKSAFISVPISVFKYLSSYDADNKTGEYAYYPDGMRKSKAFDGKTTTFYYDNQNIIGEEVGTEYTRNVFGSTGIIARKVQNKNIMFFVKDSHGDIIRTVGEDGTALVTTTPVIPTPTSYPAIISNTPEVSNFNESVMKTVSTYKYEDYGKVIDNKGATDNPFRYSGEYTDDETGFQYLRARYYNPNIRRFITEDTYTGEITNPLSLNLYGYCAGNPIMYANPSGNTPLFRMPINWAPEKHINRNKNNVTTDKNGKAYTKDTLDKLVKTGKATDKVPANYHRLGDGNEENIKYVVYDKKGKWSSEVILNSKGDIVNDSLNGGTYNYKDASKDTLGHIVEDVIPYYIWWNSKNDPTGFSDRIKITKYTEQSNSNKSSNSTSGSSSGGGNIF